MPFLIAAIFVVCLDLMWLGVIAHSLYRTELGSLLREVNNTLQPVWPAAVIVYIALVIGIVYFVLPRANGKLIPALGWGALFGFVTYATYDFTNLAVLHDWSLKITIIDTLWGMVLCGLTSLATVWVLGAYSK
ncbi:MAG: DUF2177 family protein [Gammaproteobacteria bacterium]|nr:DUF2177 family protein [Gammaproteobacteria bacterium]